MVTFEQLIPELKQLVTLLDQADTKASGLIEVLKFLSESPISTKSIETLVKALTEVQQRLPQLKDIGISPEIVNSITEVVLQLKNLGEFHLDINKPISDAIPSFQRLITELREGDEYSKAIALNLESLGRAQTTPVSLRLTLDYLKQIQEHINNIKNPQAMENSPKQLLEEVSKVENIDKEVQSEADFEDIGKILGRRLVEGMLSGIEKEFPGITEKLNELFGDNINKVTKLQSGVFKISGKIDGDDAVRYIDRLGNIHESLRTASRLTRQELEALEKEFPQLADASADYGFELENIIKAERQLGSNVVKLRIETDEGGLNLFVDNLGRAATSVRELKKQLSTEFIEGLRQQFKGLDEYLSQFGATVKDITNVTRKGNIFEIQFLGKDGIDSKVYKAYGDMQGRIVKDFGEASQLTKQQVEQLASVYENAFREASKYGGSVENLITATRDEKTGFVGLTFAIQDDIEGLKQLTLWTDKAGRVALNKRDLGETAFTPSQLKGISERFKNLKSHIEEYGFSMKHLKSAYTEVSTGITRLNFVMKGTDGIVRHLNVAIDRHGNILRDVQRKYQGFLDGVVRNTMEAAKWMVAIQLTYVPLEKFNELIQLAIDNQDKLADSAIALNMSMERMGRTFNDITEVANETGTPLNEAIEGFSAAYRATAGLGNQAQRTAVALNLLKNSLILSRLATIDQKEAMDVLISSLRQVGLPLSQSSLLLNKWIATSKSSQVSIQDLAEAYSVVGAAAKSSGFDIDTLNGIIAALAESTSYSGKQVGNIIRSFISNMSTKEARDELYKLGISVTDVNHNLRSSLDILEEISSRYSAGLINDTQLTQLARALAGGSRRAAPMITLIKTYGKALQMAKISANATNESQEALNIKLDTARSKVTQLSNAFQHLAETLGTDGGVIDVFSFFADILGGVVKLMDSLISYGGQSVTLFTTLLPALSYLSKTGRLDTFSTWFSGKIFGMQKVTTTEGEVLQPKKLISSSTLVHGVMSAMLIGGVISEALQGNKALAAYDFAGQTIGTAVGYVLGGPVGAMIGQFIGSGIGHTFHKLLTDVGPDDAKIMARAFLEQLNKGKQNQNQEDNLKKDLQKEKEEILGGTLLLTVANLEKLIAPIADTLGLMPHGLAKSYEESPALTLAAGASQNPFIGKEFKQHLQQYLKDVTDQAIKPLENAPFTIINPVRGIDYKSREIRLQHLRELSAITQKLTDQSKLMYDSGKISAAEYEKRLEQIRALSARLSYTYLAMGDSITQAFGNSTKAFEVWSQVLIQGSDDEKQHFMELVDTILSLQEAINRGEGDVEKHKQDIAELRRELEQYTKDVTKSITVRNFKLPQVIDLGEGLSEQDAQMLIQRAQKITQAYGDALTKAGVTTKEAFNEWLSAMEPVFVKLSDSMLLPAKNVLPQFVSQARRELEKEGKLQTSTTQNGFQIRQLNFSSARRGEFMAALEWAKNLLQTNFPQYKLKEQEIGVIYKDQKTDVIHADLLQLLLATNKLVEINQKQLDGIYNLPSGATFWVPWQAWNMQFAAGGSGGGSFSATRNTKEVEKIVEKPPKEVEKPQMEKSRAEAIPNIREKITPVDITKLPIEPQDERYKFYHRAPVPHTEKSLQDSVYDMLNRWADDIIQFGNSMGKLLHLPKQLPLFNDILPKLHLQQQNSSPNALRFNLELNHKVALSLDGEIIATAVSRYIGEELLSAARGMAIHKSIEVM